MKKKLLSDGALYNYPKNTVVDLANKFNFYGIELVLPRNGIFHESYFEDISNIYLKSKLKIPVIHLPLTFNKETLNQSLIIINEINPKFLISHPINKKLIEKISKKLKSNNIELLIENMLISRQPKIKEYPNNFYFLDGSSLNDLDEYNLKIALDLHHIIINKQNINDVYHKLKKYVRHFHISGDSHSKTNAEIYYNILNFSNEIEFVTIEMAKALNITEFENRLNKFIGELNKINEK